jgi:hypothetical protein
MPFLPLTNLGKELRWRYRLPITIVIFAGILGSFIPTAIFAHWLAHVLGIPADAPVKLQPNGKLFAILFCSFMGCSMVVGYLFSFVFIGAALRWLFGWPAAKVRDLMFEAEIPDEWYKDT